MVVSGSPKRWDRWHSPSPNWHWLVLSDEQMSKRWPFSLLNDEQMSNRVGVKHLPGQYIPYIPFFSTYILPSGGLHATYHLFGEPETTIEILANRKSIRHGKLWQYWIVGDTVSFQD